uniref:Ig-like domain-containing protein n=1 Tax=Pundamilia nyererei TaxID=303518 RepID=A0A3B4H0C0_9CICH
MLFGAEVTLCAVYQKIITADSGQNITLTCRAPNSNNIIVVEWSRADLEDEYVYMYRDEGPVLEDQHPSFKNRVDLQDRQMKDGDVSLILNNVTINDTGTYECRVFMRERNRRKRAHLKTDPIIELSVCVIRGEAASWLLMFVSKDVKYCFQRIVALFV